MLPPILVVGIGYRMGGIEETSVIRTGDFTPTYDPSFVCVFPDYQGRDNALHPHITRMPMIPTISNTQEFRLLSRQDVARNVFSRAT